MSFANHLKEDMRLVVLRLLYELPQYRSNSSVLVAGLDRYGHSFSRDQVKTELHWLADQGLVVLEDDLGSVLVVKLTERGMDVATGRISTHGVKRPSA
ncbi:MAG: ArsR family transcriptional regulator [Pseudomonadota bacterium]|uniref:VpaChn25_0724 family phage protein n=1 Tax=Acinetobacter baumannii TaxID=470 RepID=UPI001BFEB6C0|nr:ArsR family transcriptional regulator [Acinetobacter baumannii]MBT8175020.1 ArsR family transcriptional regulator [Acinetobacter baumannii]